MLLAEDAVVGEGLLDQFAHGRLGLAVGDGHRAGVGLDVEGDAGCGNGARTTGRTASASRSASAANAVELAHGSGGGESALVRR